MGNDAQDTIQLRYGIYTGLPENAYVVHVTFPTNSREEPLVHFKKVDKRLNAINVKLLLVLEASLNYVGVAFNGSEAIHLIVIETLIESGFPLQVRRMSDAAEMRTNLIEALEGIVKQRLLSNPVELQQTKAYLKLLKKRTK